jgi:hypothetical protein
VTVRLRVGVIVVLVLAAPHVLLAQRGRVPQPPDLQGFWSTGTATPLQRPEEFAGKATLTEAEAAEFEKSGLTRLLQIFPPDEINVSGDWSEAYLDTSSFKLAGRRRTSLVIDPANGRLPARVPQALAEPDPTAKRSFDGPESFDLDERCLSAVALGSSNATPPLIPNPFGLNFYQIVQTPGHVLIFSELVHDARIVRIGGRHPPPGMLLWLGDSIGRWENDTLVVDTTNFADKTRYGTSTGRLHVIERFRRVDGNTLSYQVTVEDPDTWVAPWTADIPFSATADRMFEFACHEANYSLGNSLRGSRTEEQEALAGRQD